MAAAGALAVRVGWALARFCVTSSGDTAGWPTALLGGVSLPAVADVPDGVPDGVPDADAVGWAPKPTLGWTSRRAIGSLRLKTLGLLNIALPSRWSGGTEVGRRLARFVPGLCAVEKTIGYGIFLKQSRQSASKPVGKKRQDRRDFPKMHSSTATCRVAVWRHAYQDIALKRKNASGRGRRQQAQG
jgi:hypothetical protein